MKLEVERAQQSNMILGCSHLAIDLHLGRYLVYVLESEGRQSRGRIYSELCHELRTLDNENMLEKKSRSSKMCADFVHAIFHKVSTWYSCTLRRRVCCNCEAFWTAGDKGASNALKDLNIASSVM